MKLVDEFSELLANEQEKLVEKLEITNIFADLCWDTKDVPSLEELMSDPAFVISNKTHCVAFHKMKNEIRYHAGAVAEYFNCDQCTELGILKSSDDMLNFSKQYLKGRKLKHISLKRSIYAKFEGSY